MTVDTNVTVGYLYGDGTVTMGAGMTLTVLGDANGAFGAQSLAVLNATAVSNTVIYMCNAFHAKRTIITIWCSKTPRPIAMISITA